MNNKDRSFARAIEESVAMAEARKKLGLKRSWYIDPKYSLNLAKYDLDPEEMIPRDLLDGGRRRRSRTRRRRSRNRTRRRR
jgi:hypothetical protein